MDQWTPTANASEELSYWRLQGTVLVLVLVIAFLLVPPAYDMFKHILPPTWRGTSSGVLGGTIGVFVYIASKLRDDRRLGQSSLGKERASKEHVSYLRNRLLSGVPSGFVLSVAVASYWPNSTDALLTAAGIVGGASCKFLSTATSAIDIFVTNLAGKRARNSGARRSKADEQIGRIAGRGNNWRRGRRNTKRAAQKLGMAVPHARRPPKSS